MTDYSAQKALIEKRLEELGARMMDIEKTLDAPKTKDDEDRATELEDQDVLEEVGNTSLRETELLHAALGRIDNGTYGICLSCDEPISEARLNAVPYAPLCKTCAAAGTK